jgi:hypothetical protein
MWEAYYNSWPGELAAAGVLLQEAVRGGHQILHLRQGAAGCIQRCQALQARRHGGPRFKQTAAAAVRQPRPRTDGHVPPLQPLYEGPYTVICRSLHHFTLRIGDKEDKVSTLRLKPCTDPTALPALPRVRGRPPAAVRFLDFPPPGAVGARRVRFAPQRPAEPSREPFFPGTPPGVFARTAAVLYTAAARPAHNRRALSRLDLWASGLEAWGETCRGIIIATTQAKLFPPPPTALLHMCVGQLIYVSLFPTVIPPTEIHVQYFTGSLFVTTYASATTVHLIRNYVALCVIVLHLKFVKD